MTSIPSPERRRPEILERAAPTPYRIAPMTYCVRCPRPAAAVMTFDYQERAVALLEFDIPPDQGAGYSLCTMHADRLTPPMGWTLTDRRNVTRLFSPAASFGVA